MQHLTGVDLGRTLGFYPDGDGEHIIANFSVVQRGAVSVFIQVYSFFEFFVSEANTLVMRLTTTAEASQENYD